MEVDLYVDWNETVRRKWGSSGAVWGRFEHETIQRLWGVCTQIGAARVPLWAMVGKPKVTEWVMVARTRIPESG